MARARCRRDGGEDARVSDSRFDGALRRLDPAAADTGSREVRHPPASRPAPVAVRALLLAVAAAVGAGLSGCGDTPATDAPAATSAATPAADAPAATSADTHTAAAPNAASERLVALTFDDLPGVTAPTLACDARALADLNDRLLAALRRNGAPAAGLVTGSRMCGDAPAAALPAILRAWLREGHALGNHTFSHRDLNGADLAWYTADIARNQTLLESATGAAAQRWFRAPLLHYGDTESKHAGLRRWLEAGGYRVARVSIDNQEWVFADVYARAKAAGDTAVMRRVARAYVPFMDSVFAYFEARTEAALGRYPPQVLLLHVNELNADAMDALVAMLRRRGYRLVPMEEALRDPWYAEADGYVGPRGLAWLHRRAVTEGRPIGPEEPREPAWLVRLRAGYLDRASSAADPSPGSSAVASSSSRSAATSSP